MRHQATTILAVAVLLVPLKVTSAAPPSVTPESMAQLELNQTNLTAALLSFLDIVAGGDVDATARFFGKQQRYEREVAQFEALSREEKQRKNEQALQEAETYKSWYPFDLDDKLDRSKDAYPQLLELGHQLSIAEYENYLKHDGKTYLNNVEDTLPLAVLMHEGKRTIENVQLRNQGRRVALAMDVLYSIPKGILSAAPMKKYYGKGASYCIVLTKDVDRVMMDYSAKQLLFGELDPAADLGAFREVKSATLKCNLICHKGDGMQVGRGSPFRSNNFGSFCLFKFNFRTPELGTLTFHGEDEETNKSMQATPNGAPDG